LKDSKTRIEPDQKILNLLKPFKAKGDQSLLVEIGSADKEFIGRRDVVRFQETNLGNLITRAFIDKFKADIAIMNSGGIRESIYPGKIIIETVLMVLPFAGEIVTAEMTGKELTQYLEYIAKNQTPGSGSFPQMAGVTLTLNKSSGKLETLKINGHNVDP